MEFLQNNNHRAVNKMKWIENRKIQSKTVGILKESLRVIVSAHVWMCVCVCVSVFVNVCVNVYIGVRMCVCMSGL